MDCDVNILKVWSFLCFILLCFILKCLRIFLFRYRLCTSSQAWLAYGAMTSLSISRFNKSNIYFPLMSQLKDWVVSSMAFHIGTWGLSDDRSFLLRRPLPLYHRPVLKVCQCYTRLLRNQYWETAAPLLSPSIEVTQQNLLHEAKTFFARIVCIWIFVTCIFCSVSYNFSCTGI